MSQEILMKIEKETQLIAELEANKPEWYPELGRWHEKNREYEIHSVEIRDAYWRRRMLQTRLEGGDLAITAQVY